MGVLIPLFFGALAVRWIVRKHTFRAVFNPTTGEAAVGFGIMTLGICLFVHGLGFVPYERVRGLKYVVAALGVGVFFLGLRWSRFTNETAPATARSCVKTPSAKFVNDPKSVMGRFDESSLMILVVQE